jgi:hypothetical protein
MRRPREVCPIERLLDPGSSDDLETDANRCDLEKDRYLAESLYP